MTRIHRISDGSRTDPIAFVANSQPRISNLLPPFMRDALVAVHMAPRALRLTLINALTDKAAAEYPDLVRRRGDDSRHAEWQAIRDCARWP